MKKIIFGATLLFCTAGLLFAQKQPADTLKSVNLSGVTVTSNKTPFLYIKNPGSISLVTGDMLSLMPKTIGVEEALRFVPGVRVDNQHDGERVHLSIRGQGILTERGLRGIGVVVDGIPLNDPSGFAPDLYDVDWATVNKIEVLRGPSAGLYGSGGAAGVLNITTNNGGPKVFGGLLSQTIGSNGFFKTLAQVDGTKNSMDYRVSYSRTDGDGYRDHQGFWSNKLYEKVNFRLTKKLSLSQILSHTDYFQQNPEGLNISQFDSLFKGLGSVNAKDLRQANPDARPFNEYQKTNRNTFGLHGTYLINKNNDVEVAAYLRSWNYKETGNKSAEYRNISNPGANAQYNFHFATGEVKHNLSAGADFKWQNIGMYKLQSANDLNRKESIDDTNLETDSLMANQIISQRSTGVFGLYKLEYGKFNFIGNVRYDNLHNELVDKLNAGTMQLMDFNNASYRLAGSYNFAKELTAFANWSQGFIPPSTEELTNNPASAAGFNTHLIPATSSCVELGTRGFIGKKLMYELTGFYMNTENDFFRFKETDRGNQEVFYGNAGNSNRKGVEVSLAYELMKNLIAHAAYTFADYKYTSATVDPFYRDYMLTNPPASGQYLPNSPKHQLALDVEYGITKDLRVNVGMDYQSKWAIYTDSTVYSGKPDINAYPDDVRASLRNMDDTGFMLFNAGVVYGWHLFGLNGDLSLTARNLAGAKYMAFTEPDPDGNSYQPGPSREFFGALKIKF